MAQLMQSTDQVKGLFQGGSQWHTAKEVKQQTMADYGAELQAQIAEKERQKKLRRQNSLRESQQLMAQRMMVPSGLVEGVPGSYNRRPAAQQAAAALQQSPVLAYTQPGRIDDMHSHQPAAGTGIYPAQTSNSAPALPHSLGSAVAGQEHVRQHSAGLQMQQQYFQLPAQQQQQYDQPSARPDPRPYDYQQTDRIYPAADARSQPASAMVSAQSASSAAADAKKAVYRAELEAQMRAKEDAKKRERAEQLQEDLKLHHEAAKYVPWGKDQPSRRGAANQSQPQGSTQIAANQLPTAPQQAPNSYGSSDWRRPSDMAQQSAGAGYAFETSYSEPQQGYRQEPDARQRPQPDRQPSSMPSWQSSSQGQSAYHQPSYQQPSYQQPPFQQPLSGQQPPARPQDMSTQPTDRQNREREPATPGTGAASVQGLGQNRQQPRAEVYFRSDKINMRPEELAAKQQQAAELQDELKQQIQAKKRAKEEEQRKEREEDAREHERLKAEQERLKQQFLEEKEAEKIKRATEAGANQKVQDAWAHVKGKEPLNRRNSQMQRSNSNASGQLQKPQPQQPQSGSQPQFSRQGSQGNRDSQLTRQPSRGTSQSQNGMQEHGQAGFVGHANSSNQASQMIGSRPGEQHSAHAQDLGHVQQAEGFSQMAAGSMMAARQAANAQLELFRAEMAAESAKIRAVVERQHAEVAELNRRAQHAEQESAAARAEVTAVRQAAAQQQAERAIAQYAHVGRLTGLPYREAQSAREYEPLPSVGPDRPGSNPPQYPGLDQSSFSDLRIWSATNGGDYGASLRGSAANRQPLNSAIGRWQPSMGDDGWGPPLDQSLIADSTLIYPRAQARSRPDSLQLSTASLRPQGAPAALRSDPSEPAGGGELQAEAMTVPFAGQGRAATPVADVDFLFSQNQSKLKALQALEEQTSQGNIEALDEFLQKFAGSAALNNSQSLRDSIPAAYGQGPSATGDLAERSITSSVRWMNAF